MRRRVCLLHKLSPVSACCQGSFTRASPACQQCLLQCSSARMHACLSTYIAQLLAGPRGNRRWLHAATGSTRVESLVAGMAFLGLAVRPLAVNTLYNTECALHCCQCTKSRYCSRDLCDKRRFGSSRSVVYHWQTGCQLPTFQRRAVLPIAVSLAAFEWAYVGAWLHT